MGKYPLLFDTQEEALAAYERQCHNDMVWIANRDRVRVSSEVKADQRKPKKGYVYLLQSPTSAYKIGSTSNPADRIRTFGIQLPFEVEFIALIPTADMQTLERRLHNKYALKRINGEWFWLSAEDVECIKALAK